MEKRFALHFFPVGDFDKGEPGTLLIQLLCLSASSNATHAVTSVMGATIGQ